MKTAIPLIDLSEDAAWQDWEYQFELRMACAVLGFYRRPLALIDEVLGSEEAVREIYEQWERDWQACYEQASYVYPDRPRLWDGEAHELYTRARWDAPIAEWRPL